MTHTKAGCCGRRHHLELMSAFWISGRTANTVPTSCPFGSPDEARDSHSMLSPVEALVEGGDTVWQRRPCRSAGRGDRRAAWVQILLPSWPRRSTRAAPSALVTNSVAASNKRPGRQPCWGLSHGDRQARVTPILSWVRPRRLTRTSGPFLVGASVTVADQQDGGAPCRCPWTTLTSNV